MPCGIFTPLWIWVGLALSASITKRRFFILSGLDTVVASLEINVHQHDIKLIAHCKQKGFLWLCR
jgi:hypothetical protein